MTAPANQSGSNPVEKTVKDILRSAGNHNSQLYAVLDACGEPAVPEKVRELDTQAVSLYRGQAEEDFWAIAPYLVAVDDELLAWIARALTGTPWGILAISNVGIEQLRRHFRKFLMVKTPSGNEVYFRFYDPRVLPHFLKGCNSEERASFFGPVDSFVIPQDDTFTGQIIHSVPRTRTASGRSSHV